MKKTIRLASVCMLLFFLSGPLMAQNGGIRFEHEQTWQQSREKALKENKLMFIDFFTEWCGPCLSMAEEVFPLMEVGNFYNTHFVNLKIDAEKGEGVLLKDKYGITSFPTYLFINPATEEIVHRSSSRQDAEVFLFTGASALNEQMRSPYLEKEYNEGRRTPEFLRHYMDFLASVYRRDELQKVTAEYTDRKEFSLKNETDWNVFNRHIVGTDNKQIREVMANKAQFDELYGTAAVDGKLFREFNLVIDLSQLKKAPVFKGKDFLLKKSEAEGYIRAGEYEKAIPVIESLMTEPGDFKEELCRYLKFVARSVLYGEHSQEWTKQCARYAQYVAYNSYDRQDPMIHYDYAQILEKLIRQIPDAGEYFPESIISASSKDYTMRSPKLKQKPRRGNK